MKFLYTIINWFFALLFFLLLIFSLLSGHILPLIPLAVIVILFAPPFKKWLRKTTNITLAGWLKTIIAAVLFFIYIYMIFTGMGNPESIYKDQATQDKLMSIYDEHMQAWPDPYEIRFLDTKYGKVHIIVSGNEQGPPLILFHASSMTGWSWLYNIGALNKVYRTYVIDTIGDAGRSELRDVNYFPDDGPALARFYSKIMDQLGIDNASLIGASQGGFIATNIALYEPQRVDKLILCGPMGYTGTDLSVLRILFTSMYPAPPVRESATNWAFGDDPRINAEVGEWFGTIVKGVIPRQAVPRQFTSDELQNLNKPVLLLLGSRDGLVGDPEETRELAAQLPDVTVEVLDTGHLISAERPEEFNTLVLEFLSRSSQ